MQINSGNFWKVLVFGIFGIILIIFSISLFRGLMMGSSGSMNSVLMSQGETAFSGISIPSHQTMNNSVQSYLAAGDTEPLQKLANPLGRRSFDTSVTMEEIVPVSEETEKKIIKNGVLNLQVKNVDVALIEIEKIAREMGGSLAHSQFSQATAGVKSGSVSVNVAVNNFNDAFARLKGIATVVLGESTSGADVTAQYIDLQARVNNKKAAEATLQTLFERAQKISDVIEVTDKLAIVRGEIESLEGQIRYLNSQTDMSSITISLTEDVTIIADKGFRPVQTLKESSMALVRMFGNFFQGLIRFLILGVPVILLYGVIVWIIFWIVLHGSKKVVSTVRNQWRQ